MDGWNILQLLIGAGISWVIKDMRSLQNEVRQMRELMIEKGWITPKRNGGH
jgi:hypothetical protein